MSLKSEKTAKLEELPINPTMSQLVVTLQRNQNYVWQRMNDMEDRINKLEKQGA
jgi:hypothetical protein